MKIYIINIHTENKLYERIFMHQEYLNLSYKCVEYIHINILNIFNTDSFHEKIN